MKMHSLVVFMIVDGTDPCAMSLSADGTAFGVGGLVAPDQ